VVAFSFLLALKLVALNPNLAAALALVKKHVNVVNVVAAVAAAILKVHYHTLILLGHYQQILVFLCHSAFLTAVNLIGIHYAIEIT
jgi:hypothetical protein